MSKNYKPQLRQDGSIPRFTDDIKVVYSKSEINSNWLLNQILGTKNKQITKVSDNEIQKFINILSMSNLEMPDKSDALVWLKRRLKKRFDDSSVQRGQTWENINKRYRYIINQIDILLAVRSQDDQ